MPLQSPIRVAISGGGLAGACLMHAVMQQSHLDAHIFESAAQFKEAGAAVGITQNARRALKLMGASAMRCLADAGAVPLQGVRWMMARGPDAGRMIDRIDATDQPITNIVHRADFLREFLASVPPERMHASKRLEAVVEAPDGTGLTLSFTDGSTHDCDILIGADGIHSRVRKLILGEDDPTASPVSAGWWFLQTLKPYDQALAVLGEDLVDLDYPVEYDYAGEGAFWLHNVLSKGSLVQCVIAVKCDASEAAGSWKKTVTAEEIRNIYQDWPPPINSAVEKLLCDNPSSTAMYLWEHLPARTYVKGAMCIVGDAAHAATAWQSSGVGMSIEDAMVLSTLLNRAQSPSDARVALSVYDQIRRPRTLRVVESSHGTGLILTGIKADFDLYDLSQMKENLSPRWNFIRYLDLTEHRDDAVRLMDAELGRSGTA